MPALSDDDLDQLAKNYAASQTPAAQDASVGAVNATNRIFGRTPGVGAPGSTPETDQTNLNIASSMERADLGNRFGFDSPQYLQGTENPGAPSTAAPAGGIDIDAVNARRNQILQNIDPDAPARYISDVAPHGGISRRQELQHELGTLTTIAHEHALETAAQDHDAFVKNRDIVSANDFSGLANDLSAIPHDLGSPEYSQALAKVMADHPHGSLTTQGKLLLSTQAQLNHSAAAINDKEYTDTLHQVNEYARSRGVTPVFDPESGMPSMDLTRQYADDSGPQKPQSGVPASIVSSYAKIQKQIADHKSAAVTEAAANVKAKRADVPYSGADAWEGLNQEAAVLEKHFPALTATPAETAPEDKFTVGKQYRDGKGNVSTYQGKGQWK